MVNSAIVIVAAGSGTRFGSEKPKQFLELAGQPVLRYSIDTFRRALPGAPLVLVLSAVGREIWREYCLHSGYSSPDVVLGGATRSESVLKGLEALDALGADPQGPVYIHDGARPLVSERLIRTIDSLYASRPDLQGVVPAVPVTDSLVIPGNPMVPFDRSRLRAVQTPQVFPLDAIRNAVNDYMNQCGAATDECSIFLRCGGQVELVEGETSNIKITNPLDLAIAEVNLRQC